MDTITLQKIVNRCKECKFATCEQCEISWKEVHAIESLIKTNEELLHKVNELTKENVKICDTVNQDFIRKSRVKEKIEEWDKSIKWANADDKYYAIKILQELLD